MPKRKPQPKKSARLQRILEDSKRFAENQVRVKRLVEEAKKQIDFMLWENPFTVIVNGVFGKLVFHRTDFDM